MNVDREAGNFSWAEVHDSANATGRVHGPWRRAVAAGIAVLFTLTLVLVGLICTMGEALPATDLIPHILPAG